MKRREFCTSLAVLGVTALVPLPKPEDALTKEFRTFPSGRYSDLPSDLTPEMLERVFEYFAQEAIEHIKFYYERDKGMMDLLRKSKNVRGVKWKKK